ncbi:tenascin-N-like isoform X3 [Denticeps clupeoides]|uniref:tenascin-N-like isoform X3 n=1 Tax=Denticeps clupeoides TaxID=299321 RepID=UPI0010A380DA|nr:tenascin-N-like isoform X3 [Denticeps clupeoides]
MSQLGDGRCGAVAETSDHDSASLLHESEPLSLRHKRTSENKNDSGPVGYFCQCQNQSSRDIPLPEDGNLRVVSVSATSAKISWTLPHGMDQIPHSFLIIYWSKESKIESISTDSSSTEIRELKPDMDYNVILWSEIKQGGRRDLADVKFHTDVPAPENLTVVSVSATSAKISWIPPHGMDQIPHSFLISYWSKESKIESISTDSSSTEITELKPDTPYTLTVCTEVKHGGRSRPATVTFNTGRVPPPENLSVEVNSPLVLVRWSKPPGVDQVSYLLSYSSEGEEEQTISTESLHHSLHDVRFCTEYNIRVCTVLNNLHHSKPVYKNFRKNVPAPEKVTVVSVSPTSAMISWIPPHGMDQIPHSFLISYWSKESKIESISTESSSTEITELKPDTPYTLTVCTEVKHGGRSQETSTNIHTSRVPAPENLSVDVNSPSVSVRWSKPPGVDQISYLLSYSSEGEEEQTISTDSLHNSLHDLWFCTEYKIRVCTVLNNLHRSKPIEKIFRKTVPAPEKVTVVSVSATSAKINWILPRGMDQIPHSFLISYWSKESKIESISTDSYSTEITELKPDTPYTLTVWTEVKHGGRSQSSSKIFRTGQVPAPDNLFVEANLTLVLVTWSKPPGVDQVSYLLSYSSEGEEQTISTESLHHSLHDLRFCTEYNIRVCTVLNNLHHSKPVEKTFSKTVPAPEKVTVVQVSATSAKISWILPHGMDQIPHSFLISYCSKESKPESITTDSYWTEITELKPDTPYTLTVSNEIKLDSMEGKSDSSAINFRTVQVPPPENLSVEVNLTSVSVRWSKPPGVDQVSYLLSYSSEGEEEQTISTETLHHSLHDLRFCTEYKIRVCTVLNNLHHSKPIEKIFSKTVPAPEEVTVVSVSATSAKISWIPPHGMDQIPHSFLISYWSKESKIESISTESYSTEITELKPDTPYMLTVWTEVKHGGRSQETSTNIHTVLPAPEKVTVVSVSATSAKISWIPPHGMDQIPHSFLISYWSKESKPDKPESISTDSYSTEITELKPDTPYTLTVCTQVKYGGRSQETSTNIHTTPPMPENLTVPSVSATSAKLTWSLPYSWGENNQYSFLISYHSEESGTNQSSTGDKSTEITGLTPYTEYTVSVRTVNRHGVQSSPASSRFHTVLPAPEEVTVVSVSATSAKISWIPPHGMDQIPHSFLISYWSKESKIESISTDSCRTEITDLKPDTPYTLTVCTEVKHGGRSQETSTNIHTTPTMPENLTVSSVSATSAKLTWSLPSSWGENNQYSFLISYHSEESGTNQSSTGDNSTEITGLTPYTEYTVSVRTVKKHGVQSSPASSRFHTVLPAPEKVTVVSVSATSAKISWILPHGMDQIPHSFLISYWSKESKIESISTDSSRTDITELKPDTPYTLTVCTEVKHGGRSQETSTNIHTTVPAPEMLTVVSVSSTSAKISWIPPHGMDQIPHSFLISYWSKESKIESISTDSSSTEITELKPDTPYTLTVCTEVKHGGRSQETSTNIHTTPTMPENLTVSSVSATSAKLTWSLPSSWGENNQYSFLISYHSEESGTNQSSTGDNSTEITGLTPYTEYTVSVRTVKKHGVQSSPASSRFHTVLPAPEKVTVVSVSPTSAKISWIPPHGMDQIPHSFLISYWSKESKIESISTDSCRTDITDLKPDTPYTLTVCTEVKHGGRSQETSTNIHTILPAPENLTVVSVSATSAKISWIPPHGMDQIPHSFLISYWSKESKIESISTDSYSTEITELNPDTPYTLTVCTEVKHGGRSQPATVTFNTEKFRFYTKIIGKLPIQNTQSLKELLTRNGLVEVNSVEKCDVVLAFCLVVSRAGTDIEAALAEINKETKPEILVVMHHTFRTDVFPDSSRFVRGEQVLITVDCLFHEDQGLLRCQQNNMAFTQIQNILAHLVNKYTPSKQEASAGREDHV